ERGIEGRRRAQRLPGLTGGGAVELDHEHHVAARHLVARNLLHRGNVARIAQMLEVDRIERGLAYDRAFARRELADNALIDRVLPIAHRGDLEDLLHLAWAEIAA